jgi:uncharacterized protein (TIGR04141 family)
MASDKRATSRRTGETTARTWPLNVFLIHQDLREDKRILGDLSKLKYVPLQLPDGGPDQLVSARLYFAIRQADKPKWASFFGDLLAEAKLPGIISVPAILLVPVAERLMAVAFSYGSALMEPGVFDPTFGLRTALNSIKPGKVRSYDKRTFDALFRQTREQAAQVTKLENFGIDAERDLVRTVSGKPENKALGTTMAGGGSVHVSVRVTPDKLVSYLRRLYNQSRLKTYTEEYPWLGRIEEVLDREIKATLDSYLDERLQEGAEGTWLASPEIIDTVELAGFRFILANKSKNVYPDLNFENLCRASRNSIEGFGVEFFRDHSVEMVDSNDKELKKWTLYDCLNAEILLGYENYVLSSGVWYRIDSDLIGGIDQEIESLETADLPLPEYDITDKNEYAYNCRVADLFPERFCCLDDEKIMFGGGRSRFELCDLLESSGTLIHVKRYGGSSVLSHLFAQGLLSAELLMKRPGFRENADALVESKGFSLAGGMSFRSKVAREVVYVIIGGPANVARSQLPLFSRVNLRNAVRTIRGAFDWNVKVQYVAETELRRKYSRAKRKA